MSRKDAVAEPAETVAANLRRNFATLGLDYGFFGLGMSFVSTTTILPALADRLGAPNMVLGALPSLVALGRSLPAIFSARLIESQPRRLPAVLAYTGWERVPWLILAIAVYTMAESRPTLVLAILVATLSGVALVGGALSPAWADLVARVIPTRYRGRFFATGGAFSTLLGLGGAVLSGYFLEAFAYPAGYAACIAAAFACLVASWMALAFTKEGCGQAARQPVALTAHLSRLPAILRSSKTFSWYLVARSVTMLGSMATGFYTVYSLRFLGAQEWNVASFTFVLLASQAAGGLALGALADRTGHRTSMLLGAVGAGAAAVLAIFSTDLVLYHAVFAFTGLSMAASNVSSQTLVFEIAPEEERPTYLGLSSTLLAPFILAAPVAAGLLADSSGLRSVFAAAAVLSGAAVVVYLLRVREPRHAGIT